MFSLQTHVTSIVHSLALMEGTICWDKDVVCQISLGIKLY